MPPIFPSNFTYPRQGYIIPFPKPIHQEKYFIFDDNTIESIINTVITPEEQREIESLTFLPLVDLVKPGVKKLKDNKAPRSQNVFVIFRKDQQARLTFEKGPSFTSQLKHVSVVASKLWKEATAEQKTLYDRVSYITKQVHKHLWPDYSYKPNRRDNRCNFPPLLPPPHSSNSPPSTPLQFQYRRTLPLPTNSFYFPQKYSYHQNKILPSPISSFSPNNTHLLEINPSNTMNDQYDKFLRNSLNKFSRLSL